MKLKSLCIEPARFSHPKRGKLIATIKVEGTKVSSEIELPEWFMDRLLGFVADEITAAVTEQNLEFKRELQATIAPPEEPPRPTSKKGQHKS